MGKTENSGQEKLDFYNCLRLLDTLVINGLIKKDPNDPDKSRILVYRAASEDCPEGWYSENVHAVARDLAEDAKGQQFLLGELEKRKIGFSSKTPWWLDDAGKEAV